MIFFIIALVGFGIRFFLVRKQKSKKEIYNKINLIQNKSDSKDKNNVSIFAEFIEKIDLNDDTKIFKHSDMVVKCIRAGIRSPKKQKGWIFARYGCIIPGALFGLLFCNAMITSAGTAHFIFFALVGVAVGFYFPVIRLDSMFKDRKTAINTTFPDFIDLMLVCVEAGMTAEQSYVKIADDFKQFSVIMADEIEILSSEITYFLDPKNAYDSFYARTQSEYVKAFVSVVLQSIQYGTPLSQGLKMLSAELRESQIGEIERKAASLPSKLTVPMMIFTLPVLFVVILYPAISQAIATFNK